MSAYTHSTDQQCDLDICFADVHTNLQKTLLRKFKLLDTLEISYEELRNMSTSYCEGPDGQRVTCGEVCTIEEETGIETCETEELLPGEPDPTREVDGPDAVSTKLAFSVNDLASATAMLSKRVIQRLGRLQPEANLWRGGILIGYWLTGNLYLGDSDSKFSANF